MILNNIRTSLTNPSVEEVEDIINGWYVDDLEDASGLEAGKTANKLSSIAGAIANSFDKLLKRTRFKTLEDLSKFEWDNIVIGPDDFGMIAIKTSQLIWGLSKAGIKLHDLTVALENDLSDIDTKALDDKKETKMFYPKNLYALMDKVAQVRYGKSGLSIKDSLDLNKPGVDKGTPYLYVGRLVALQVVAVTPKQLELFTTQKTTFGKAPAFLAPMENYAWGLIMSPETPYKNSVINCIFSFVNTIRYAYAEHFVIMTELARTMEKMDVRYDTLLKRIASFNKTQKSTKIADALQTLEKSKKTPADYKVLVSTENLITNKDFISLYGDDKDVLDCFAKGIPAVSH